MRFTKSIGIYFLMVLLLCAILAMAGCSSPTTTTPAKPAAPTTASQPAAPTTVAQPTAPAASATTSQPTAKPTTSQPAAPTTPAAAKPIELSVAPGGSGAPPSMGMTLQMANIADLVKDRTKGQVTLKNYWGQALVKQQDIVTGLQTGICDIGVISAHTEPGKVPLALVGQQPGVGTDMWARSVAFSDICAQDPEMTELSKLNIRNLTVVMTTEQYIISRVPIRSLADLKGKRLATAGMQAQILQALGGVGVALSPGEQVDGLAKGTIDAIICPTSAVNDFKFYESGKYFIRIPFGYRTYPVGINMDVWKKLSPDIQKILTDASPDMIKTALDAYLQGDSIAIKAMQDNKIEFIDLNAADMAAVVAVHNKIADDWAATLGDPGKKILADYRALEAKYEKISPYKK
jgi:TRAP-type C4-dicarboxylate transport system substrate-binding protein